MSSSREDTAILTTPALSQAITEHSAASATAFTNLSFTERDDCKCKVIHSETQENEPNVASQFRGPGSGVRGGGGRGGEGEGDHDANSSARTSSSSSEDSRGVRSCSLPESEPVSRSVDLLMERTSRLSPNDDRLSSSPQLGKASSSLLSNSSSFKKSKFVNTPMICRQTDTLC